MDIWSTPYCKIIGPNGVLHKYKNICHLEYSKWQFWSPSNALDLQGIAPQDTIKAGHYESLKKIDTADEQERIEDVVDKEIVSKLKTEESILKLLASNQSVVDSVIERLNNLKVKPNDLLHTDIC